MICHKYRCIFIHIPKCAGSSIEKALGHAEKGPNIPDHRSIRMLQRPLLTWASFAGPENARHLLQRVRHSMTRHANPLNALSVSKEQYSSYFKFAIVRNPWARAFSWYGACIHDARVMRILGIDASITFPEFLHRQIGKGALRPQLDWLRDFQGNVPLDFIGRFESLHEDIQTVCGMLGIPYVELQHARRGKGGDYRDHYDAASREMVARIYSEEIERFGYSFENGALEEVNVRNVTNRASAI